MVMDSLGVTRIGVDGSTISMHSSTAIISTWLLLMLFLSSSKIFRLSADVVDDVVLKQNDAGSFLASNMNLLGSGRIIISLYIFWCFVCCVVCALLYMWFSFNISLILYLCTALLECVLAFV